MFLALNYGRYWIYLRRPYWRAGRTAIAPVLKTGGRKPLGVRIPRSPQDYVPANSVGTPSCRQNLDRRSPSLYGTQSVPRSPQDYVLANSVGTPPCRQNLDRRSPALHNVVGFPLDPSMFERLHLSVFSSILSAVFRVFRSLHWASNKPRNLSVKIEPLFNMPHRSYADLQSNSSHRSGPSGGLTHSDLIRYHRQFFSSHKNPTVSDS